LQVAKILFGTQTAAPFGEPSFFHPLPSCGIWQKGLYEASLPFRFRFLCLRRDVFERIFRQLPDFSRMDSGKNLSRMRTKRHLNFCRTGIGVYKKPPGIPGGFLYAARCKPRRFHLRINYSVAKSEYRLMPSLPKYSSSISIPKIWLVTNSYTMPSVASTQKRKSLAMY